MTHKEALTHVDGILNSENVTWQEKKNRLADLLVSSSKRPRDDHEDNFNFV